MLEGNNKGEKVRDLAENLLFFYILGGERTDTFVDC